MKLDKPLNYKQKKAIFNKILARAKVLRNHASKYEHFAFPAFTNVKLLESLRFEDEASLYVLLFHPKLARRIWTAVPICEHCHNLLFDQAEENYDKLQQETEATVIIMYKCGACKKLVNGDQTCYEFMMENLTGLVAVAELEQNGDLLYNYLNSNLLYIDKTLKKRIEQDLTPYTPYL